VAGDPELTALLDDAAAAAVAGTSNGNKIKYPGFNVCLR
jgi:hypothetical protein